MRTRTNPNPAWPIGVAIFGRLGILIAIDAILANCGGGSRQLIAITVQPSDGDVVAPTGALTFTATGTFNQPPTTQTDLTAHWTSSNSSGATIDPNTGRTTCVAVVAQLRSQPQ